MEFRIGINIGDVVQDGDSLYGEGVNIAARIEGLADPGGICISRGAYDHIKNKLKFGYEFIGEHSVKNIKDPVRVYKILMAPEDAGKLIGIKQRSISTKWVFSTIIVAAIALALIGYQIYQKISAPEFEPASVEKMALPLPEKPSIAVLAFDNMSGDQAQDYIADGLSENIISSLSKIPDMVVIARNSSFVYKGKAVKVNLVAEELGVRYVLEGSVQTSGDSMRVTAQLVDAINGHHLWSEKYDRPTKDFFTVQDEITRNIVIALQVELTEGEQARIWHSTKNLEAWGYATKGIGLFEQYTKEKNVKARELFKKAVVLDPNYESAWIFLAWTHFIDFRYGFSESRSDSFKQCIEITKKVALLDDSQAEAHSVWNVVYLAQGQYDKAIAEGKKAIELSPSNATNNILLAMTLLFAGKFEESIFYNKKAMRLDPYYGNWYAGFLASSYSMAGEHEKAIAEYEKFIERAKSEGSQITYVYLVHSLVSIGQIEEARAIATEQLKADPSFSLKKWQKSRFYKNPKDLDRVLNSARKAGLPEKPPLQLPDKPSIAVLAFDNMSGDPEQGYFSDGISEDIITTLSKTDKLFVIARNSTFAYKGKSINVKQIAEDLGVRYVLEGSVRKSEEKLRVTAQLIDATTGHHLWAERYDRDLKDFFLLQDEITTKIVTAMRINLTDGEQARMWGEQFDSLELLFKIMEARSAFRKGTKESLIRYGQLGKEMTDIAPESPVGYLNLAAYNFGLAMRGISPKESIINVLKHSKKAIAKDDSYSLSHAILGQAYLMMRQYDKAIAAGKRAVEIDPNGADVYAMLGITLGYAGKMDEAIRCFNRGLRLNPHPPSWYFVHLGRCYRQKGEYEQALAQLEKVLHLNPDSAPSLAAIAAVYALLNRQEEANAATKKVLKINPDFTVKRASKAWPYKNQNDFKLLVDAMHKAGLP